MSCAIEEETITLTCSTVFATPCWWTYTSIGTVGILTRAAILTDDAHFTLINIYKEVSSISSTANSFLILTLPHLPTSRENNL